MRKIILFMCAGLVVLFMAHTVFADHTEKKRIIYSDKQTYNAPVVINDDVTYGADAEIKSNRRYLNPPNMIHNSLLGIWSGGSRYGVGGTTCVPDGWTITGTKTGVSRVEGSDTALGSGATVYPGFPHSMLIENWATKTGPGGTTAYVQYPAMAGVSPSRVWYQQFAGKRVVFGAWVNFDVNQYVKSAVTTNFMRPYILTYTGANNYVQNATSFAFGPYVTNHGWTMVSAVTDVPTKATALEVGFELSPTILAAAADDTAGNPRSGDSIYVCAPFLLVDPLQTEYVPNPQEEIYFDRAVEFYNGTAANWNKGVGTSSYNVAQETLGKISPNVSTLYVTYQAKSAGSGTVSVQFRTSTASKHLSGATFYPVFNNAGGTSNFSTGPVWVPTDYNGDFDVYTSEAQTGVSLTVTGAKMRQ